jgi:hypothetical protein
VPLDAQSDGTRCATIAGYTWRSELCEPVYCGCTGSDCGRLFATMTACDLAYQACYSSRGLQQSCYTHADCALVSRTCCPSCGQASADGELALNVDSKTPAEAGLCEPELSCPDCASFPNPQLYAVCLDGCRAVDVGEQAACESDVDCRLTSKDCCDCGGDFSPAGVMAVGRGYTKPEHCAGIGCDECVPSDPPGLRAVCDAGACAVREVR